LKVLMTAPRPSAWAPSASPASGVRGRSPAITPVKTIQEFPGFVGLTHIRAHLPLRPSHLAPCLTRWRREGWHRLPNPLDNLGIRARLTLRKHLLDKLDRALNLLVRRFQMNLRYSTAGECEETPYRGAITDYPASPVS